MITPIMPQTTKPQHSASKLTSSKHPRPLKSSQSRGTQLDSTPNASDTRDLRSEMDN